MKILSNKLGYSIILSYICTTLKLKTMKVNVFYLKVRVELDKPVTPKQLRNIVEELDYSITTKKNKVVATEIVDEAIDHNFEESI